MKHIFFAFPAGSAGMALVLFRSSAAICIIGMGGRLPVHDLRLTGLTCLAAVGLLAGFPTRAISAFCAVAAAAAALTWRVYPPACLGAFILSMLALLLIGPGAYSVDATLFGRRTLRLRS